MKTIEFLSKNKKWFSIEDIQLKKFALWFFKFNYAIDKKLYNGFIKILRGNIEMKYAVSLEKPNNPKRKTYPTEKIKNKYYYPLYQVETLSDAKDYIKDKLIIEWFEKHKIQKIFVSFLENNKKNKQSVIEKGWNFQSMITSTIDKKIKKLVKRWFFWFWSSKFSRWLEKDFTKQIEKLFLNSINYEKATDYQTITKTFISKRLFWKPIFNNYLQFIKQDKRKKNKINWKVLINQFVKRFLKKYLWDLEKFVENLNYKILIDYHLYKTERIENAIIDNFYKPMLYDLEADLNLKDYITYNFPRELDSLLAKKLENELEMKWVTWFEIELEALRQKRLIYCYLMIYIMIDSIFNVINDNILQSTFNEKEIALFINKEKNKIQKKKNNIVVIKPSKEDFPITNSDKTLKNSQVDRKIIKLLNYLLLETNFRPPFNADEKIIPNSKYKKRLVEMTNYNKNNYNNWMYKNLFIWDASSTNNIMVTADTNNHEETLLIWNYDLMQLTRLDSFIISLSLLLSSSADHIQLKEIFKLYKDAIDTTIITPWIIKNNLIAILQNGQLNTWETEMFLGYLFDTVQI